MSYTYATFKTALANEIALSSENDAQFVALLPTFIDYSEQRCYRELDLLATSVLTTGAVTANNRLFTLPTSSGHVLEVEGINIFDASSVRHPVLPATRDVIDTFWPSDTAPSVLAIPKHFARTDDTRVMFGPSPGSAWSVEVWCTVRPDPLSASNTTTFLSQYLSDLFFSGAMISASGYMRNFGAQADDPKMALSWESLFQTQLASANKEEMKKKYIGTYSAPPASTKVA
jgi:hypothetical protein